MSTFLALHHPVFTNSAFRTLLCTHALLSDIMQFSQVLLPCILAAVSVSALPVQRDVLAPAKVESTTVSLRVLLQLESDLITDFGALLSFQTPMQGSRFHTLPMNERALPSDLTAPAGGLAPSKQQQTPGATLADTAGHVIQIDPHAFGKRKVSDLQVHFCCQTWR